MSPFSLVRLSPLPLVVAAFNSAQPQAKPDSVVRIILSSVLSISALMFIDDLVL